MTAAVEADGRVAHVHPVRAWRPSWAVGACRQAAEGTRPDVVDGGVRRPCAGSTWPVDGGAPHGCGRGDGHYGVCGPRP